MNKFQRKYTLGVEDSSGNTVPISDPITLDFSIQASITGGCNSAIFRLHGLKESTRARLYKDPYTSTLYRSIYLTAGYGDHPPVVFKGNLQQAYSVRQEGSVDHITELQCFDGGFAFNNAKSSFTLPAGTTQAQLIGKLVQDLGATNVAPGQFSQFDVTFGRGIPIIGNTVQLIQKWAGMKNPSDKKQTQTFISQEKIYCLNDHDTITGSTFLISSETGLLGSPKRCVSLIECQILFEPRIRIGQQVELFSISQKNFNGTYKVVEVSHRGTISGAVGGKCITKVSLFAGDRVLEGAV